jgi:hypothetical protein
MKAIKPLLHTNSLHGPVLSLHRMGRALLLVLLSVSLLTACNRQGPMGPEGPQGPDGKDGAGGGGGGGVTTYLTRPEEQFAWEAIDGWSGYTVMNLKMTSYDQLLFPQNAATTIDAGGPVLVSLLIDQEWHALPFKESFSNSNGTYEFYVNYEIVNGQLRIEAKISNNAEGGSLEVQQMKIVVAPASKTIPLAL